VRPDKINVFLPGVSNGTVRNAPGRVDAPDRRDRDIEGALQNVKRLIEGAPSIRINRARDHVDAVNAQRSARPLNNGGRADQGTFCVLIKEEKQNDEKD
jgi:hypothetical protein